MGSDRVSGLWSTAERLCEPMDEGEHEDVYAVQAKYHNADVSIGRNGGRAPFTTGRFGCFEHCDTLMGAAAQTH